MLVWEGKHVLLTRSRPSSVKRSPVHHVLCCRFCTMSLPALQDLVTARNGAPPPRNQQRAAQRRAKAAALDRKTAARHRRHRDCLLKQIKKGARLLNQQKEKRAAEERRKCRRQQHEEMLQRAAERKRRRRERHNLTAALAQRRHWRLGLKMLLLLVIFAAYLECAAAMFELAAAIPITLPITCASDPEAAWWVNSEVNLFTDERRLFLSKKEEQKMFTLPDLLAFPIYEASSLIPKRLIL